MLVQIWYTPFKLVNASTRQFRQLEHARLEWETADAYLPCIETDRERPRVIWVSALAPQGTDTDDGDELCKAAVESKFPGCHVLMSRKPIGVFEYAKGVDDDGSAIPERSARAR